MSFVVTFLYGKDVNTLDIDEDQETQQEGAAVEWLGYWTWDRGFAGSNPCYNNNPTQPQPPNSICRLKVVGSAFFFLLQSPR